MEFSLHTDRKRNYNDKQMCAEAIFITNEATEMRQEAL